MVKDARQRVIRKGQYWTALFLALALLAALGQPTLAQTPQPPTPATTPPAAPGKINLALSAPDFTQFPSVQFYLDPRDAVGGFIQDLRASDITMLEDGSTRPLDSWESIQPGLQIIAAINVGPNMLYANETTNRFGDVKAALLNWIGKQPSGTPDDFSLITNTGPALTHSTDLAQWKTTVDGYKPDLMLTKPTTSSLGQAVDLGTIPAPRPNMHTSILYITVLPPTQDQIASLPTLAQRSAQAGTPVNVWLVTPPNSLQSKGVQALQDLADTTGGSFFIYTGRETLPDIEAYFKTLRFLYKGAYTSAINFSGSHSLAARLKTASLTVESAAHTFQFDVQPPNPIFLSPPSQVIRTRAGTSGTPAAQLTPGEVQLKMMVEYPDNHPRSLKASRLYVDGVLQEEISQAPFDRFAWNLDAITISGQHTLRVEVTDVLGMTKASIDLPVDLVIEAPKPQQYSPSGLPVNLPYILGGVGAALAVIVLVGIFFLRRSQKAKSGVNLKDPVTQPVKASPEPASQPRKSQPLRAPVPPPAPPPPKRGRKKTEPAVESASPTLPAARLMRLNEAGSPILGSAISLGQSEITLGSDPALAIQVLDSPAVSGVHARIRPSTDGGFILSDAGSVAGTWLNFAPVSQQGAHLEHGDLVHIGNLTFRFELNRPGPRREPVVTTYEE